MLEPVLKTCQDLVDRENLLTIILITYFFQNLKVFAGSDLYSVAVSKFMLHLVAMVGTQLVFQF